MSQAVVLITLTTYVVPKLLELVWRKDVGDCRDVGWESLGMLGAIVCESLHGQDTEPNLGCEDYTYWVS